MKRLGLLLFPLLLGTGCAQYGLELRGSDPSPVQPKVMVPEDVATVARALEEYLRERGSLESKRGNFGDPQLRFTEAWRRGLSLRYHFRSFGDRDRHLSEWKSQWTLKSLGPQRSELSLKILEVIYIGVPNEAGVRPEVEAVKNLAYRDWFETPPDDMRALFELRRFWTSTWPRVPLPQQLANLKAPALDGPPASKEWPKAWVPQKRRTAF
jgi:hypothetical protein